MSGSQAAFLGEGSMGSATGDLLREEGSEEGKGQKRMLGGRGFQLPLPPPDLIGMALE